MNNITATDFYKPTPFNPETLNQIWMSQISDSHDNFCNCNGPFAHLLASIFPPGHKDRKRTIEYILQRDYLQCRSGGEEGAAFSGPAAGGDIKPTERKQEDIEKEELEKIFAAEENPEEGTR